MNTNTLSPIARIFAPLLLLAALLGTSSAVEPPKGSREFKVGVTTPATNYKIEIKGIYKVGAEIWVVSKVGTAGDIGGAAITKVSDAVKVKNADLPAGEFKIRQKVTGKSWNWDEKGDGVEHVEAKKLEEQLKGAKKIPFTR